MHRTIERVIVVIAVIVLASACGDGNPAPTAVAEFNPTDNATASSGAATNSHTVTGLTNGTLQKSRYQICL